MTEAILCLPLLIQPAAFAIGLRRSCKPYQNLPYRPYTSPGVDPLCEPDHVPVRPVADTWVATEGFNLFQRLRTTRIVVRTILQVIPPTRTGPVWYRLGSSPSHNMTGITTLRTKCGSATFGCSD